MKRVEFLIMVILILASCSSPKIPKEQYDAVYKTTSEGYPEFLLIKKLSDSTVSYLFSPEDYKKTCEAQMKGVATNQFYKRGADIEIQKDGSGMPTYRFAADNYKCTLVLTTGYTDKIKVHSHCNGGNICPNDAEYIIDK